MPAPSLHSRLLLAAALLGCGPAVETDAGVDAGADAGPSAPTTLGTAERPASLVIPPAHDGTTPLPALVLLHGYTASGQVQELYFAMTRAVREAGFYLVLPDGTIDEPGNRFWNATDACCDFEGIGVDDVAYIRGLIDELETVVPVDPDAIFLMGHSNGGFMSYRMACEASDRIAAIVSLAGSDFLTDSDCVPAQPVSVLQIHGDADTTVLYGGGTSLLRGTEAYPGAADVVARWAARAGCDLSLPVDGAPLDIEATLAGAETRVTIYADGCTASSELWTIEGGTHIPALQREFTPMALDWLLAHRR